MFSDELSHVGNYQLGDLIGKGTFHFVMPIGPSCPSADYRRFFWESIRSTSHPHKDKGAILQEGLCLTGVGRAESSGQVSDGRVSKRDLSSSKAASSPHHKIVRSGSHGKACLAGLGILSWYNSVNLGYNLTLGGELYDYLVKRKRVKEHIAQKMFAQLCGAVAYIHKAGCVHR